MNIYNTRQILKTKSIYDLDLRVVYYARVSTERDEQKNSIINQRDYFEDLIKSNKKWKFSGSYIDDGVSGIQADKRERFQKMISDAENGKFDLIITKEISRFARNTLDSIQYTRRLLSCGVCVWFQNDNINTIDDDSEFRLTIMAGVAQDEVRKLSSRIRFGHAQAIKNGVVLGNSKLYGYDKKDGRLTINEDEADMVRLIFEKYATGAWTTPRLEKLLFEKGYRNYNGGKIGRSVIQHIIKNPKYKGYYVGRKVRIIDMFTKKQEFLPEEEWVMYKDDGTTVPAIVDEETWDLANKYFNDRGNDIKSRRTSFKYDNIFTGKIFCENDNSPYWMKQHSVKGKSAPTWVCSHRIKNGATSCTSFPVAEKELQSMLATLINSYSVNIEELVDSYLDLYKESCCKKDDHSSEIQKLNQKISTIRKKMDKILDYNLSGSISDDEFIRRNDDFNNQIKDALGRIEELSVKPETLEDVERRLSKMVGKIKKFSNIQQDDINKEVVDNLIEKISIEPLADRIANVRFYINTGEERSFSYDKKLKKKSCSEHIFFTIYPPTLPFCLEVRFPLYPSERGTPNSLATSNLNRSSAPFASGTAAVLEERFAMILPP